MDIEMMKWAAYKKKVGGCCSQWIEDFSTINKQLENKVAHQFCEREEIKMVQTCDPRTTTDE